MIRRMFNRGFFITFEGTDGAGKTTQAKLLKNWLEGHRKRVVLTREPGGGRVAERIRALLLNRQSTMEDLTELFLYQAARVEHTAKVIRPALRQGKIVICDRFTDATIAYQGNARGLPRPPIHYLNRLATGNLKPDLTLWLDLPPRQALRNAQGRHPSRNGDRMESEGVKFQDKVRRGYLGLARAEPRRIKRIRVQPSIDSTQQMIRRLVGRRIPL